MTWYVAFQGLETGMMMMMMMIDDDDDDDDDDIKVNQG